MNMARRRFVPFILSLAAVGCGQSVGAATGGALPSGVPIDASIAAVSLSKLDDEQQAILNACGITNTNPNQVGRRGNLGTGVVAGMGRLPHARDIVKYAAVGPHPNIDTDTFAWVITTQGWITLPLDTVESKDPTCYIVGDNWLDTTFTSTGGTRSNGVVDAPPIFPAPILRLPPLTP
jgi:hypothetical protein